jgi:hypothetical protein
MRSQLKVLVFALVLSPAVVVAAAPASEPAMACDRGPVQREFGAATWNIYACSDNKSVVVVPGKVVNGEFGYFFVTPNGTGVTVAGEGWGKDATFQPVYQQLQHVTGAELKSLVQAAQAVTQRDSR